MDTYVVFFGPAGAQGGPVKRDRSKGDKDDEDAISRLIVELGNTGWELVGVSNHGYQQWLYFKRPLP